jgi:hypothetical protein
MRAKITPSRIWMLAATLAAMLTQMSHSAIAQTDRAKPASEAAPSPPVADAANRAKVLRAAADALGMVRWSDIGAGPIHLPAIDAVNTMDIRATGAVGQSTDADYHVALAYNPPAMRVEITRKGAAGPSQRTIATVREKYAWNESEIGASLEPGKGTATPANADLKERLLQLWILPYGVVKAALAAGDKTIVSTENGATVITFPLSGSLADVTVKATLDSKNLVTKVETRSGNTALTNLVTETEYSDYADHGELLTDIKSPGHIVEKQAGRPVLDIRVKMVDANNPYLVFPVPPNVKAASVTGK